MEVFYVMVLVLVAGAFPSHGRTESEGTVFNTTQPHESMNNVTVSSSKLEAYDSLLLAMQWPRSFCNYRRCPGQVPGRFTVHGLWPQYAPSFCVGGIDCTVLGIYGHYQLFNNSQLGEQLAVSLNHSWPDLTRDNNNQVFWKHEYDKHGSCTYNDQNAYFQDTVRMAQHLEAQFSVLLQNGGRLTPGRYYQPNQIRDAVRDVTQMMPKLHCIPVGNRIELLEIRFCARLNARRNRNELGNCNFYSNCGDRVVLLPRP